MKEKCGKHFYDSKSDETFGKFRSLFHSDVVLTSVANTCYYCKQSAVHVHANIH